MAPLKRWVSAPPRGRSWGTLDLLAHRLPAMWECAPPVEVLESTFPPRYCVGRRTPSRRGRDGVPPHGRLLGQTNRPRRAVHPLWRIWSLKRTQRDAGPSPRQINPSPLPRAQAQLQLWPFCAPRKGKRLCGLGVLVGIWGGGTARCQCRQGDARAPIRAPLRQSVCRDAAAAESPPQRRI